MIIKINYRKGEMVYKIMEYSILSDEIKFDIDMYGMFYFVGESVFYVDTDRMGNVYNYSLEFAADVEKCIKNINRSETIKKTLNEK